MAEIKLYNSLTRKKEIFKPLKETNVGIYTCGPTVYSYVTIGNWRTNILADFLNRMLTYFGYQVKLVMNITDVGHLTDDGDDGRDKLEKAAEKEKKTAWKIAEYYTKDFLSGLDQLNIIKPDILPKATDHIEEQIKLITEIEKAGFTYQIDDGVYFDVQSYEKAGNDYGRLSSLDEIKPGARVMQNHQKKDPRDFALWKFSPERSQREMEWPSPWGKGFPGWHIECSAMSMKYLGDQFDMHVGGEDLKTTHHPNEIAQAESATGKKPFVKYWIHGAFLLIDGGKMSKSLGNDYTLADIVKKGFHPLDLRYFYLTGHYRKQLNFTWEALENARKSRLSLINSLLSESEGKNTSRTKEIVDQFNQCLADDLNIPQALAVFWQGMKTDLTSAEKAFLAEEFDQVLGLDLTKQPPAAPIPDKIKELAEKRECLRRQEKWDQADKVRHQIEKAGFSVEDLDNGYKIVVLDE